ncbi:unnamed protein product [Phyllotreta striolata]|uniref:Glutaredoxin domain-containing protein n=1 Tax=Phyllotreta striolata TaxID=444603 RepID=A0A9P0GRB9_PHYSR|nr:unnamed protein product [Phyllotreta striolata]
MLILPNRLFVQTVLPVSRLLVRNVSSGKQKKGIFGIGFASASVGLLLGTGYSIYYMNKPNAHLVNEETRIKLVEYVPDIKPSKIIKHVEDRSGLELTLYQYQTCPFCCKVRAFLDYYGISYNVIEVDPVLRQAIKWSPYKKVPILVAKSEQGLQPLNDSSMIVSAIATYLFEGNKDIYEIVNYYPFISYVNDGGRKTSEIMNKYFVMLSRASRSKADELDEKEERKWRSWADEVLVHTLSPNVYRTRDEALQAFRWFSDVGEWEMNFPAWERHLIIYAGAAAMWLIGKRLKKRHNLKDDVRQSLYDECNVWLKAVRAKGGRFLGGDRPNLGDLAVYGVLSSIEGCRAFEDLLGHTKIGGWYFEMKEVVGRSEGAKLIRS